VNGLGLVRRGSPDLAETADRRSPEHAIPEISRDPAAHWQHFYRSWQSAISRAAQILLL